MKKFLGYFIVLNFLIYLFSCTGVPLRPSSATSSGPRTIILDGISISEEEAGGFTSWFCYDFVYEEKGILLEVGFFGSSKMENLGYILYDGGYTGEFTHYQRVGLEHRWDWGPNETDFSFVIKSDGTGLYYDFRNVRRGDSVKARDVFKCYKK